MENSLETLKKAQKVLQVLGWDWLTETFDLNAAHDIASIRESGTELFG